MHRLGKCRRLRQFYCFCIQTDQSILYWIQRHLWLAFSICAKYRSRLCINNSKIYQSNKLFCKFLSYNKYIFFYCLPDDKILSLSKIKAFADDNFSVARKVQFFFYRVENMVGKGEKCWLPAFSPFPAMFSKCVFSRVVKVQDCSLWQPTGIFSFSRHIF